MNQTYIDTVRLLLAIAPAVFASGRFAMKGGTALNLFVKQMPRLSVDIDLVLVDHRPDRHAALQAIGQELAAVQAALAGQGYRAHLGGLLSGCCARVRRDVVFGGCPHAAKPCSAGYMVATWSPETTKPNRVG